MMFDCYCENEYSDVWIEKTVRARKEHICCECGGKIRRGEIHNTAKSLYEGEWSLLRRCPACQAAACDMEELTSAHGGCFCNMWGDMRDRLWEILIDGSAEEIRLMRPIIERYNANMAKRGGNRGPLEIPDIKETE